MTRRKRPVQAKSEIIRQYAREREQRAANTAGKREQSRDWHSLIEERIARININNLPGKGKPLHLSVNPYVDPDEEASQRIIRNAGFTLPWIEDGRQIDADLALARRALKAAYQRYRQLCGDPHTATQPWVEAEWQAALDRFQCRIEEINRQIRVYNLRVPALILQKFVVRVEEELTRLEIEG